MLAAITQKAAAGGKPALTVTAKKERVETIIQKPVILHVRRCTTHKGLSTTLMMPMGGDKSGSDVW